ncbi:MAG: NAD(P)-dependent alcohol dehydrogenase [Bacteroidota bacterium]
MKIATFRAYGGPEQIEIQDLPPPSPTDKELLIKVKAAALNPKDIIIRRGKFKAISGTKFPQKIGFDFSGTVVRPDQKQMFKEGDQVYGMIFGSKGGACAEYLSFPADKVYHRPQNISHEEAAGIPLAGMTALQALKKLGRVKLGDSICINGASGGVGTLAIQIAKELGARVLAVSSHRNTELCQELGADEPLDYTQEDLLKLNQTFDVFFDVFGNYSFRKIAHLLSKKGIYITTVPKPAIAQEYLKNPFRSRKAKLVIVQPVAQDLAWLKEKIEAGKIKARS